MLTDPRMESRIKYLKGSVSRHSRSMCSGECIFLNGPGCTLASLPMCWESADCIFAWMLLTVWGSADHIFAWTLLTGGVSGQRNSSIRCLKPGEGSMCRSAPPEVGIRLSCVEWGAAPLSKGRNSSFGSRSREGSACRSAPPKVGIMLLHVGWGIPLSKGGSEQGHMIVSLAVGWNRMEKEPLKQCLKNTWRHVQKTRHGFSFRAPKMRSAGVGDVGTSSCSCVHLQVGRGVRSQPHAAKAACLGVKGGGLV